MWKCWGSEPKAKKEFLRCLGCKQVFLLRHGDRSYGQRGLPRDCEEQLIIYYGIGGGKARGSFRKDFHADSQNPGGLAIVKLRWFFPLARHSHGSSWRTVVLGLPQVFVSGLQLLRKFTFTYISFCPCSPHHHPALQSSYEYYFKLKTFERQLMLKAAFLEFPLSD